MKIKAFGDVLGVYFFSLLLNYYEKQFFHFLKILFLGYILIDKEKQITNGINNIMMISKNYCSILGNVVHNRQ